MRHTLPRLVARLIAWLATLRAPRPARARMRAEWDAELAREIRAGGGWRVVGATWGAFADAAALRELQSRGEGTMTIGDWLSGLRGDVALAMRGLARAPGFAAVAVLTLAIGLGGSGGMFALIDRVVLDPLPYPAADRLVRLENQVPGVGPDEVWALSTAQLVHFTDHSETLDAVGLFRGAGGNVATPDGLQRAGSVRVTASMMDLLGANARLGRLITPADDEPGAPVVAVLSHGFWTRTMGADPGVVGTSLTYNDEPVEIIGVMDPDLALPGIPAANAPDLWMPMRIDRGGTFYNSHVFPAIGRLAADATPASVEAELLRLRSALPERFPRAYSQSFFDQYGFRTMVTPLKEHVVGELGRNLWLLFGGVALVLLIACANVANLFVVRVEAKRRELGIRAALGASRPLIARYLLAEGMTLAAVGGVFALLVGYWAVPALTAIAPDDIPRIDGAGLTLDSAGFTLGLALLVGLAISSYPMLGYLSRRASADLGDDDRGRTASKGRQRFKSGLVVTQVALAVTLVVGAAMLIETMARLQQADTGMDADGVLAVDLYLGRGAYDRGAHTWNIHRAMIDRVAALPGVTAVGMGQEIPVAGYYGCTVQGFEDTSVYDYVRDAGMTTCAGQQGVSPGYFDALSIPLVEGRGFELADSDEPSRGAVVVSRAFAERFWPGESAIGQGVNPSGRSEPPFYHVVGVVDDVARASDDGRPPLSQTAIAIYYPPVDHRATLDERGGATFMTLLVRTDADDPTSLFPAVRTAVLEVESDVVLADAMPVSDVVDEALADLAFVSLLLAISAATALILAAVGLYGVVSYVVSRRTREIGMRLAIGARPAEVVRSVVGGTLALVAAGLLLGIPLALGAARLGRSLLVGAETGSPSAYLAAAAILTVVALAASWLPARRAAHIDPVDALRAD